MKLFRTTAAALALTTGLLTLPAQASVELNVVPQGPRETEPAQRMPRILETVDAVPGGGGMGDHQTTVPPFPATHGVVKRAL